MKNKFLEAFYSMEDDEAQKQVGVFLETIKINVDGIELTSAGIKGVLEHIQSMKKLTEEIQEKNVQ